MEALAGALEDVGVHTSLVESSHSAKDAVVIVDSYLLRADDHKQFQGEFIAAIDDLQRDLAVDLVIDPCPGADQDQHRAARRVLLGPRFAPLDPLLAHATTRPPGESVEQVLITAGASSTTVGVEIATKLTPLLNAPVRIRLVLGPWSEHDNIEGVEIVRTTSGLVQELAAADLVVTAAGVTMLEALALGRPTVAFVLAENQQPYAEGVVRAGAAVLTESSHVAEAASALAGDPDRRRVLAAAARALVDAHGARRVAEEIRAVV
jgi:spore coat polysaccharide biosynthesis predicted glycosyltransferase SpsG